MIRFLILYQLVFLYNRSYVWGEEEVIANLRSVYVETNEEPVGSFVKSIIVEEEENKYRLVGELGRKTISFVFEIIDIVMVVNENIVIVSKDNVTLHCSFDTESNAYKFFESKRSAIPQPVKKFVFNLAQIIEFKWFDDDTPSDSDSKSVEKRELASFTKKGKLPNTEGSNNSKLIEKMGPALLTIEKLPKIEGNDAYRRIVITDSKSAEQKYVVFSTSFSGVSASNDDRVILVVEEKPFMLYFYVLHFASLWGDNFITNFGDKFNSALSKVIPQNLIDGFLNESNRKVKDERA